MIKLKKCKSPRCHILLGGLMERSLANSPNSVWGAGEETWMKTTVPYGTSQRSTTKKFESKGQRENSKATEQCVSPTLLFWHSSGSSQLMGDGEHSNVSGGKSVGIPHGALLSKPRDKW